ncbi:hypothetical protein PENTCL1PPCAC_4882, partial [Pristionchus entomophagus]
EHMDGIVSSLQVESKMLRLTVVSLLLLCNSVAASPGRFRDSHCMVLLQNSGEISERSIAAYDRCSENVRNRVETRAGISLSDDSSAVTLKCLLVIESAKAILEPEVYDRLRSCYADPSCADLMGPCEMDKKTR